MSQSCNITFIYHPYDLQLHRVRELAVAVILASKHYDVAVWTNFTSQLGALQLPCRIHEMRYLEQHVWSINKIRTHKRAASGCGTYLHIDSDVFLYEPLPTDLLNSTLFAQNPEGASHYMEMLSLPNDYLRQFATSPLRGFNCGIVGGTNEAIQAYAEKAYSAAEFAEKRGLTLRPTWVEQATLATFDSVNSLFPGEYEAIVSKKMGAGPYVHLVETKNNEVTKLKVKQELKRLDPILGSKLACK